MATPYITPAMLQARPAGLSWTIIPRLNADTQELAGQLAISCQNATSTVDSYCHQPLRSVLVTEELTGPGRGRVSIDRDTGNGVLVVRRWPVTGVYAIQVSPARSFPRVYTPVPAGLWEIRHPVLSDGGVATGPSGGWTIDVASGYVGTLGRGGQRFLVSYTHGWPHCGLTAAAAKGDETVQVDDVTGWGFVDGNLYDGPFTELGVTVTAGAADQPVQLPNGAGTVQAGPGTLALSAPLQQNHSAGTVLSAVPANALRAAVLAATVEALEGIAAIATQSLSGAVPGGVEALANEYEMILDSYSRVT